MIPKVLIASPTANVKNYCIEQWMRNVDNIMYPNADVVLFDNTQDGGHNADYLNDLSEGIFVNHSFNCFHSDMKTGLEGTNERLAIGHNDCREYALNNGYEYLLHLESDIFPPHDIVETLMHKRKSVIGAVYYRDEGKFRKPMIQKHEMKSKRILGTYNMLHDEDFGFMDGNIKKVAHVGLGAVLIHKSVLKKIKFRSVLGNDMSPDSFFAEDCYSSGIPIYVDTSVICFHRNIAWGIYGIDWK